MTKQLTTKDTSDIQEHLRFLKSLCYQLSVRIGLTVCAGTAVGLIFFNHLVVVYSIPFALAISLYLLFNITLRSTIRLRKDLRDGVKNVEKTRIAKVKTNKSSKKVITTNGLEIDFNEFESYGISKNEIVVNNALDIEFTPNDKMILKIELK